MNSNRKNIMIGMCKIVLSERDIAYKNYYLALTFIIEALEIVNGNHSNTESFEKKSRRVRIVEQNLKLLYLMESHRLNFSFTY